MHHSGIRFAPARYARLRKADSSVMPFLAVQLINERIRHVLPMSMPGVLPMCVPATHPNPLPLERGPEGSVLSGAVLDW